MVKSTVRFPESVVEEIEHLVEDGSFESKSEFYRFATDYMLEQLLTDYDPETIDYEAIKADVLPDAADGDAATGAAETEVPLFESVAMVRQFVLRGRISDAEDFIDHQYTAGHPHAMLLEELLYLYRTREQPPAPSLNSQSSGVHEADR